MILEMKSYIKTDWCNYVPEQVTVKYNRKLTFNALRTTMHYCPKLGEGRCPVHGIPGHLDFRDCPVFPPSEYFSQP